MAYLNKELRIPQKEKGVLNPLVLFATCIYVWRYIPEVFSFADLRFMMGACRRSLGCYEVGEFCSLQGPVMVTFIGLRP